MLFWNPLAGLNSPNPPGPVFQLLPQAYWPDLFWPRSRLTGLVSHHQPAAWFLLHACFAHARDTTAVDTPTTAVTLTAMPLSIEPALMHGWLGPERPFPRWAKRSALSLLQPYQEASTPMPSPITSVAIFQPVQPSHAFSCSATNGTPPALMQRKSRCLSSLPHARNSTNSSLVHWTSSSHDRYSPHAS